MAICAFELMDLKNLSSALEVVQLVFELLLLTTVLVFQMNKTGTSKKLISGSLFYL